LTLRIDARDLLAGGNAIRALRVDVDGSVRRHALRVTADAQRAGVVAAFSGGLAADGRWSGRLGELTVSGTVPARLVAPVPVEIAQEAGGIGVRVGVAALEGGFGAVRVARAAWRAGRVELVADASLSQLGRIAETFGLTQGVEGARETLDLLSLTLRADVAGSSIDDVAGTLAARLEGAPGAAGSGSADLAVKDGALSGPLQLELPTLVVANRLIGPAWAVDGRIRFAGRVIGTRKQPRLVGDIEGSGLRLQQHAMGWRLRDGTLAGRFDGERFRLDSMKLYSGPAPGAGSVELKGEVRVADLEGRFDLLAERFAVLIGPGQRVVVSGRGEASSKAGAFEIKGQLRADEGRIEVAGGDAPTLPNDVVIVGARARAADAQAAAAVRSSSLRIASDVTLDLGDNLRVHGSGIDARLAGSLNLRGALPDAPRAYGTVRIREGRYRAYGQELQITRGLVVFNGPIDNPQLDIIALRREQAVEAGVAVTGTALSPQVRLTSRPEVPDAEKLSWLVLGVPLDGRSGGQGAALQAAAATLFGSNDGALAGGLANALGLDMLTIRSGSTGGQGLLPSSFGGGGYGSALPPIPGQVGAAGASAQAAGASGNVLALGKRLSSRVLLTYEQGLHGVWNLLRIQYDITRRLSLRAQTGSESAIDLLYRYSFD
jgi:translocation and assembly module TamB